MPERILFKINSESAFQNGFPEYYSNDHDKLKSYLSGENSALSRRFLLFTGILMILDLFVNDHPEFKQQCEKVIDRCLVKESSFRYTQLSIAGRIVPSSILKKPRTTSLKIDKY